MGGDEIIYPYISIYIGVYLGLIRGAGAGRSRVRGGGGFFYSQPFEAL